MCVLSAVWTFQNRGNKILWLFSTRSTVSACPDVKILSFLVFYMICRVHHVGAISKFKNKKKSGILKHGIWVCLIRTRIRPKLPWSCNIVVDLLDSCNFCN